MADAMTPDEIIAALGSSAASDDEWNRACEAVRDLAETADAGVALARGVLESIGYQPAKVVGLLHRLDAKLVPLAPRTVEPDRPKRSTAV